MAEKQAVRLLVFLVVLLSAQTCFSVSQEKPTQGQLAWKKIANRFGWTIEFPANWDVANVGEGTPETADNQVFQGPTGCYPKGQHCGYMQVDAGGGYITPEQPKEHLLRNAEVRGMQLLSSRDLVVGGEPAFEITALEAHEFRFPDRLRFKEIAVKHKGKLFTFYFYEYFVDPQNKEKYVSPAEWEFESVFERMIASFKFLPTPTHRKKRHR
jgi:hypothetical protein